jgi:predicted kinase
VTEPAPAVAVLVSGPPAAGKTTLAKPLAAELGFALLAKDQIKEILHDSLGEEADLAWSQRLGATAMELLWGIAVDVPAVVLEANFWPDHPALLDRLDRLHRRVVEVHCVCPLEVCQRRYAGRALSRHGVHVVDELSELAFARCERPVGFGRVITVDTSLPVEVAALSQQVRGELGLPGPAGLSEGTVSVAHWGQGMPSGAKRIIKR